MKRPGFFLLLISMCIAAPSAADDAMHAHYLANAGVLIANGETKIVFDPLFDNDYGIYERVPADIEAALMSGEPPFDGLDAAFVSHHHGDHFSPQRMLELLRAHPDIQLFAPQQAIDALPFTESDDGIERRVHAVALDFEGRFATTLGTIEVNAVRIPHSGWPKRHTEVENLAFHVTLDEQATVLHMGDAHWDEQFFADQADYWAARETLLALPPYWMFLAESGLNILDRRVRAAEEIGIHVPHDVPDSPSEYPAELEGRKLFSVPGETHSISLPGARADEQQYTTEQRH